MDLERFGDFKPREHNLLHAPIAQTVFEPRVGDNIVDRAVDGTECRWARILVYEPLVRVVFSWDISPQWSIVTDPDMTSEVEVRFHAETPQRTSVELEHRHIDRHRGRPSQKAWTPTRGGRFTWPARSPARGGPMTVVNTEVQRPAAEVFAYVTDPTRFSEWQQGVVDGYMDQPDPSEPPAVGTRCMTTRHIGAANRSVTSEITHIDPPRAWGVRGIDGPIRATVDVSVEPLAEARSRLSIAVEFEGHGIGKILVPLLVNRQARIEMPGNLTTLKDRVEAW